MLIKLKTILFSSLLFELCHSQQARYDNYHIYKANASNTKKLEFLRDLESSSDSIIILDGVHGVNKSVTVVVAPHKLPDFLKLMEDQEIDYELRSQNAQVLLDGSRGDMQIAPLATGQYDWHKYYQLDDTYEWLNVVAKEYSDFVTLVEVGRTYENRTIMGVKISKNTTSKPGIFVEAGIHAREWIASATATYLINQLLTSEDTGVRTLTDRYNWYIVPHANPDGFVYSFKSNRLWRKTRKPFTGGCFGADPNRNWDFQWNRIGSSNKPCADTYAGPSAFSEVETRSLAEFIENLGDDMKLYIALHSFSQLVLHPYGHTSKLPKNHKDLKQVLNATLVAIRKRHGTKYSGGNTYSAIYPASGGSIDWVYSMGTKMAFLYELRPKTDLFGLGFLLSAKQIIPTGEETLDAIRAMVDEVEKLGYFHKS